MIKTLIFTLCGATFVAGGIAISSAESISPAIEVNRAAKADAEPFITQMTVTGTKADRLTVQL